MKVLKADERQYTALDGYENKNHKLSFVKDADDNWIVGKNILKDDRFKLIHPQLRQLEEINFKPIIDNE